MYFYCTSKIKNYYKVGIASSLDRVKKRLTTYRSSNPLVKIKFFSDIGSKDSDIEWSYKNKFGGFRISKSECYKLDFDIIYKHFLKFQHKNEKLHHFWNCGIYYLSEYYFDKKLFNNDDCDFSETSLRNSRFGYFEGFIPIAYISSSGNPDKEGNYNFQCKILDVKKVDLREYRNMYSKHLKEKFWNQQYGYISREFEKFFNDKFTIKKNYKAQKEFHLHYDVGEKIYNIFKNKFKSLIKKYPDDPKGCAYWEKPEQKSLTRYNDPRTRKKILSNFSSKYDLDDIMESISSSIPKNDPKVTLQTFQSILFRFSIRTFGETNAFFREIDKKLEKEILKIDENNKIELVLEKQKMPKKKKKYLRIVK